MTSKHKFLAIAAAGTLLVSGIAQAAVINVTISPVGSEGDDSAPRLAETNFLNSLEAGYLTEDFEGFDAFFREDPFGSSVGSFDSTVFGSGGACENDPNGCDDGAQVLDSTQTLFGGRFNTTVNGENWLDSMDAQELVFTPNSDINAIGFYITDPNDSGGIFDFIFQNQTVTANWNDFFGGSLTDGRLFYVTVTSDEDLLGMTIRTNDPDDGYGIDDVTIGRVPEPGALALMGLGLVGIGFARRRRLI